MADQQQFRKQIEAINDRLRVYRPSCKVWIRGGALYLRATLPIKTAPEHKKQQWISLGAAAVEQNLRFVEERAVKLCMELRPPSQFKWSDWSDAEEMAGETLLTIPVSELVERFQTHWLKGREMTPGRKNTWRSDYLAAFKKLDQTQPITEEDCFDVVCQLRDRPKTHDRACTYLGILLKFAGINHNLGEVQRLYNRAELKRRELPSDEQIEEFWEGMESKEWRFVFGLMAAYGLRNHEIAYVDFESLKASKILKIMTHSNGMIPVDEAEGAKTNKKVGRIVLPYLPNWYEKFELSSPCPPDLVCPSNGQMGQAVYSGLSWRGLGDLCTPYDLRHAWAVRTVFLGVKMESAAKQMGHSYKIHTETYHDHIAA